MNQSQYKTNIHIKSAKENAFAPLPGEVTARRRHLGESGSSTDIEADRTVRKKFVSNGSYSDIFYTPLRQWFIWIIASILHFSDRVKNYIGKKITWKSNVK